MEENSPLLDPQQQCDDHPKERNSSQGTSQGNTSLNDTEASQETTDFTPLTPNNFTSCPAAVFLTVNATLGAGLLNMPYAFKEGGGIGPSVFMQVILMIMAMGGLFILSLCTNLSRVDSFQSLVGYFCGKRAKEWTSFAIFLHGFGCCITFIIIIGDQIDRLLASSFGTDFCHYWYMNRTFTMTIISIAFILPMCFSRDISFLKYPSYCGVVVMTYVIILAYFEWTKHEELLSTMPGNSTLMHHTLHASHVGNLLVPKPHSIIHPIIHPIHAMAHSVFHLDVIRVVPTICFAYQCHLSWVPTIAGMRDKSVSSISLVMTIVFSFLVCFTAYTCVSVFGLLTFGQDIASDLMVNYDARKAGVMVAILVIAFKTVTTYPIMLYCARTAIDDALVQVLKIGFPEENELVRRIGIVIVWFFSTLIFAVYVPDISSTINLVGGLAILFIFLIPGCTLISAVEMKRDHYSRVRFLSLTSLGVIYVLLGTFIFGITVAQVVIKDFFDSSIKPDVISLCVP